MAEIRSRAAFTVKAVMELDEQEMRAMEALVGYGTDQFLEAFYKVMGKAYLQPHESGLRSLFQQVNEVLRPVIGRIDGLRRNEEEYQKRKTPMLQLLGDIKEALDAGAGIESGSMLHDEVRKLAR